MKLYQIFLIVAIIVEILGQIPPYSGILCVGGLTIGIFSTGIAAGFIIFAWLSMEKTDKRKKKG